MATKRDQLHAHQFMLQRRISALVTSEADPEQPPFRRPSGAAVGSIVIGLLALAAVFVYGLVVPGGGDASWKDGKSVLVVKETGARFVYVNDRLFPVPNYTSALLALGRNAAAQVVARDSLAGVPRGPEIGIEGAPDALPGADKLLTGGWTLCSQPAESDSGSIVDRSALLVGTEPSGGELGPDAVLVEVPATGNQYLLWQGFQHPISRADAATVDLATGSAPRARAATALVDSIPVGEAIGPIAVPDAGAASRAVPDRGELKVGQLLQVPVAGGTAYYLAQADQLRPISALQYDIQRAYPDTRKAYGGGEPIAVPLSLASVGQARQAPAPEDGPGSAPRVWPTLVDNASGRGSVCATYTSGAVLPRLRTVGQLPPVVMTDTGGRSPEGLPLADEIYVEPGRAALVEVMPSAEVTVGTLMVVTDEGRGYPLAGPEVQGILGYGAATPVQLPAGLVGRLPLGVGLDPTTVLRRLS